MNFRELLERLRDEPEWAVLVGLLVLLVVAGGAFLYYRYQGQSASARNEFRRANTAYTQASRSGDYERSIQILRRYVNDYPDAAQTDKVHFMLGKSYHESGDQISAIKQFKQLLNKFPGSLFAGSARLHVGYANLARGAPKPARDAFEAAVAEYEDHPVVLEARWQLALVNLELDRTEAAVRQLDRLLESSPNEGTYWTDWARRLHSRLTAES